ncbi:hypothetical protein [Streptomyces sp. NPDC093097]|uniref:hypothetical protein n=1 Tax=Streptomyces sp. NPDC093097 TaxID=3366027 RepID=UPI0037F48865
MTVQRLLARIIADLPTEPAPGTISLDDRPVGCPFGWHDMDHVAPTVWNCEHHGATLIVHAPGPPVDVKSRMATPRFRLPTPPTTAGCHHRP